ncbi:hypothetical protein, partial [Massilia sp. TSP1-1-2]|uniref:hypothetical protein n=1 Tax=Massilia sp. TSP1-1-2 TaxID=2804649 RepID=UPI003CED06E8
NAGGLASGLHRQSYPARSIAAEQSQRIVPISVRSFPIYFSATRRRYGPKSIRAKAAKLLALQNSITNPLAR